MDWYYLLPRQLNSLSLGFPEIRLFNTEKTKIYNEV